MMDLTGGCLCQKVRYKISEQPISQGICYCRQCQKAGGALGSPLMVLRRTSFECSGSNLSSFTLASENGSKVTRYFCQACGSPIFSEISEAPEIITVKTASLDSMEFFKPEYLVWTNSAAKEGTFPMGVPSFPENAPLDLLLKL